MDFGLESGFETDHELLFDRNCCHSCRELTKAQRRPFKFNGYSNINPRKNSRLTDHQYFLCDRRTEAYVLKQRKWSLIAFSGFWKLH
jgi:hypothetical protein